VYALVVENKNKTHMISGDTVVSRVSSIYIERYMSTETLPCIFTRAGEMRAPEIFGSQ